MTKLFLHILWCCSTDDVGKGGVKSDSIIVPWSRGCPGGPVGLYPWKLLAPGLCWGWVALQTSTSNLCVSASADVQGHDVCFCSLRCCVPTSTVFCNSYFMSERQAGNGVLSHWQHFKSRQCCLNLNVAVFLSSYEGWTAACAAVFKCLFFYHFWCVFS